MVEVPHEDPQVACLRFQDVLCHFWPAADQFGEVVGQKPLDFEQGFLGGFGKES